MKDLVRADQADLYLRIVKRWWWLPLFFGITGAVLAYVGTRYLQKPHFVSTITVQVISNSSTPSTASDDAIVVAMRLTTQPVFSKVSRQLDPVARRDPRALFNTSCSADQADRFVTCWTLSRDPLAAAASLNDLVQSFARFDQRQQFRQYQPGLRTILQQEQQLKAEVAGLESRLASVPQSGTASLSDQLRSSSIQTQITQDQTSLSSLTVQESTIRQQLAAVEEAIRVIQPALPDSTPIGSYPERNAFLGFIVGLALACALIVLLEYLDDTFRSIGEVTEVTGLRVLGAIRRYGGPTKDLPFVAWRKPGSATAEAYRVVRSNIQFANVDRPVGTLLMTSAAAADGKTTTVMNLGATMAAAGRRVLLVDADLQQATLTKLCGLPNDFGFSTAYLDVPTRAGLAQVDQAGFSVVPAGPMPPVPSELFGSDRVREWLEGLRSSFDLIIIDAPPILSVADTRTLAALADAVVLVVNPERTTRRLAREAKEAVESVGARALGVIVNKTDIPAGHTRYYSSYSLLPAADAQSTVETGR